MYYNLRHTLIYILTISLLMFSSIAFANDALREKSDIGTTYNHVKNQLDKSITIEDKDWKTSLSLINEVCDLSKDNRYEDVLVEALFHKGNLVYYNVSRDSSLQYYLEGYKYAVDLDNKEFMYKYCMELAKWYLYRKRDNKIALEYFNKAIVVGTDMNNNKNIARAYAKSAIVHIREKDQKALINSMEKCEFHYLESDNNYDAAYYYGDIGTKVWDFDMTLAVDFYLRALELSENHYYPNLAIGSAYNSFELHESAIKHLEIAVASTSNRDALYGTSLTNLAEARFQLKEYEVADSLCDLVIEFYKTKKKSKRKAVPEAYHLKGKIQETQGNYKEALSLFNEALDFADDLKTTKSKYKIVLSLGDYHMKRGNYKVAKDFCIRALEAGKFNDLKNTEAKACTCLHLFSKQEQDFEKALEYLERKDAIENTIKQNSAVNKLIVLEKLQIHEKQSELEQKLKDDQLKAQASTNRIQKIALLIGALILLTLSYLIRKIRNQNKEINTKSEALETSNTHLMKSNEELERFAYSTSHDLKTPMVIIVQFAGLLKEKLANNADPIIQESIKHIDNGGRRMMNIIDSVLEYSKTPNIKDNNEDIDLSALLKEISDLEMSSSENLSIEIKGNSFPILSWNYTKIFLLFKNLIENGLKYNTSTNPRIDISGSQEEDYYQVIVKDNGIGIEENYFDEIFMLFKRLHNQSEYEGSGMGLATCKKIVDDFEGEISLESQVNKGTKFIIQFPNQLIRSI